MWPGILAAQGVRRGVSAGGQLLRISSRCHGGAGTAEFGWAFSDVSAVKVGRAVAQHLGWSEFVAWIPFFSGVLPITPRQIKPPAAPRGRVAEPHAMRRCDPYRIEEFLWPGTVQLSYL